MKKEYDFIKADRGKFFRKEAKLGLPIYLDDEVWSFVHCIAEKQQTDTSVVVNKLIRSDMQLAEVMKSQ